MHNDLPAWKKGSDKFAQVCSLKGLHLELTLSTGIRITEFFFPFYVLITKEEDKITLKKK